MKEAFQVTSCYVVLSRNVTSPPAGGLTVYADDITCMTRPSRWSYGLSGHGSFLVTTTVYWIHHHNQKERPINFLGVGRASPNPTTHYFQTAHSVGVRCKCSIHPRWTWIELVASEHRWSILTRDMANEIKLWTKQLKTWQYGKTADHVENSLITFPGASPRHFAKFLCVSPLWNHPTSQVSQRPQRRHFQILMQSTISTYITIQEWANFCWCYFFWWETN